VLPFPVSDFEIVEKVVEIPLEPLKLINLSQNADGYYWDFGDGNVSDEFEPVHYYQEIGLYDIKLEVFTNSEPQCTDTMVVRQTVRTEKACRMIFPTGFTPVKSGPSGGHYNPAEKSNTVFYPINTGLEEFELEIYNRWGEIVFYSDDINVGWDGYINGRAAPMGVYVWRAKAKCESGREIEQAGDVTVVR
jgi:PKD repeat protein